MSKIKLGVNIDHIAFIKKSRDTKYPDLREAVSICESSGADSITIHLREDRRHIQDQDAILIRTNATKLNDKTKPPNNPGRPDSLIILKVFFL